MGETKPTNITLGQRLKHRSLHLKPVSLDCKKVPVAMPGCTSFWKIWFCIKTHVFSIPVTCVSKNHPMWWFFSDICIKKIIPLYPSPRFGHLFMESPKLLSLITLWGGFSPRWTIADDPWDDRGCLAQDRKPNTTTFPVSAGAINGRAERKRSLREARA